MTAGMDRLGALVTGALATRRAADRLRALEYDRCGAPSTAVRLDVSHNDYLGLRHDPAWQRSLAGALAGLPLGAGGSRLLGGDHPVFAELETEFARWLGAPSALWFPTGFAANLGLLTALAALPGVVFISDELNHASIVDGLRLGVRAGAARRIYRHGDLEDLERQLGAVGGALPVIVTESVYSMDGDVPDLAGLRRLAAAHGAVLVVDEAHAHFALGPDGRGLMAALAGGDPGGDCIRVSPCGKAMGGAGALVSGPAWLRDWLINSARSFIYSTGGSPWTAAALLTTLRRGEELAPRRRRLAAVAAAVRTGLVALDLAPASAGHHIIPVILGPDARVMAWQAALRDRGIRVAAARPPTVPEGTARLRLSVHAGLSDQDVADLIAALRELREKGG